VRVPGNLKYAAPPLPVDAAEHERLLALAAGRPVWLAASTHPGEEEIVADAHRAIAARLPGALTLLVPRHAQRGDAIAAMLRARGLVVAQRSAGEPIADDVEIYLADTMGELGLFYRLAPIGFIGKSLAGEGGQNPLEAAALDTAILGGPRVSNFEEIFARLVEADGARLVADGRELADAVVALSLDTVARQRMAQAALDIAAGGRGAVERVLAALAPVLAPLAAARRDARA
jgi:3-deoxy-D-manno-octulosonic-acid transferase